MVSELTYNLFRNHLIFEYEIPKVDIDTPRPNVFINLSKEEIDAKCIHLKQNFKSQQNKQWYTWETFHGLAKLRGIQSNNMYAEAFVSRKIIIDV